MHERSHTKYDLTPLFVGESLFFAVYIQILSHLKNDFFISDDFVLNMLCERLFCLKGGRACYLKLEILENGFGGALSFAEDWTINTIWKGEKWLIILFV